MAGVAAFLMLLAGLGIRDDILLDAAETAMRLVVCCCFSF